MKRLAAISALVLMGPLLRGQDAVSPDAAGVRSAEEAIAAKLPEVAIEKLHAVLRPGATIDEGLRQRAEEDLTQATLESGDMDGVLTRLEYPANDQERVWKAEAFAALGRWPDAERMYAQVATDGPSDLQESAGIGDAEALHALGMMPEALAVLSRIAEHSNSALVRLRLAEMYLETRQLQPAKKLLAAVKPNSPLESKWRLYIEGRIYLAEDQAAPALQDFDELVKDPRGLTEELHAAATVGLTEARAALNGLEAADNEIEDYIYHYPDSAYLEDMFRRLDRIYASEERPSEAELIHWASKDPPRRAALGQYYLGKTLQRQPKEDEKAIRAYTEFVQRYPKHALAFDAWMQLGQLYLKTNKVASAIQAFEGAMRSSNDPRDRAQAEIATGNAHFAQGDFLLATESFHDAAQRGPDYWLQSTYDDALAWLNVPNYDKFLEDYTELSARYPEKEQRRDLLLEKGLLQARSRNAQAATTLESFIRDFPENRRVPEARLAMAELIYVDGDTAMASNLLQAAYESGPSDQSKEQADYLAIFIADAAANRNEDQVIKLGQQFLASYPTSALRAQVRMKLGQVYFRREDFANAQTQFETLAQDNPADPLADQALILAGQSSVSAMSTGGVQHALTLFSQVAKGTGPLKLYARQEQALLEVRQGHPKDAVIIYDDILRSNPDTQLRLAALCGKADCLVATESGTSTATSPAASTNEACEAAIALYDLVVADPEVTTAWRNEALFKKARCLTRQGLPDAALVALYDVLNGGGKIAKPEPEFAWYEKAGFEAASTLENKAQWPGAISVLEKVSQAGGPRSAEAKKHAEQLRLDHFVWD